MTTELANRHRVTLDEYRASIPAELREIGDFVESAIADAEAEGVTFRPDARQFLLVNIVELLGKPMSLMSDARGLYFDLQPAVGDRIMEATRIIVEEARKSPDERNEISGHQTLRAVDKTWPKLSALAQWG